MGVFDFVRDIGAKVGIGKSTAEKEAEEAKSADLKAKGEDALRKAAAAATASNKAEKKADAAKKVADDKRKAVNQERYKEYRKSIELEKYVRDLGLDAKGLDIRFDDGVAYVEGEAADQATKEKIILAVGNVDGVGQVQEEMSVAAAQEPAAEFHTVESGDTLWAVAQKVYGDGNRYTEIFEANKPMLKDPDLIYPGQVLRCPK